MVNFVTMILLVLEVRETYIEESLKLGTETMRLSQIQRTEVLIKPIVHKLLRCEEVIPRQY